MVLIILPYFLFWRCLIKKKKYLKASIICASFIVLLIMIKPVYSINKPINLTPEQFANGIISKLRPEILKFVGALASIYVVKKLIK